MQDRFSILAANVTSLPRYVELVKRAGSAALLLSEVRCTDVGQTKMDKALGRHYAVRWGPPQPKRMGEQGSWDDAKQGGVAIAGRRPLPLRKAHPEHAPSPEDFSGETDGISAQEFQEAWDRLQASGRWTMAVAYPDGGRWPFYLQAFYGYSNARRCPDEHQATESLIGDMLAVAAACKIRWTHCFHMCSRLLMVKRCGLLSHRMNGTHASATRNGSGMGRTNFPMIPARGPPNMFQAI